MVKLDTGRDEHLFMHSLNQRAGCSQTSCLVTSGQDLSEGCRVDITVWHPLDQMHLAGTGDAVLQGDTAFQGACKA